MQAFHNNPELKAQAIADMQAHIAADQLVKGQYWENGKGCFIGCAVKSKGNQSWHGVFQERYNIDQRLAELFDAFFEGLPNKRAMRWPIEVYNAIEVGADVAKVADEFMYWLLTGKNSPLAFSFKEDKWGVWNAIKGVAALYAQRLAGNEPTAAAWNAAKAAARAAAWNAAGDDAWNAAMAAAWNAAMAAAWNAARDAAWAAADAALAAAIVAAGDAVNAAAAAEAAARAAAIVAAGDAANAADAARAAAYVTMADILLELLAAKPTQDKGE